MEWLIVIKIVYFYDIINQYTLLNLADSMKVLIFYYFTNYFCIY